MTTSPAKLSLTKGTKHLASFAIYYVGELTGLAIDADKDSAGLQTIKIFTSPGGTLYTDSVYTLADLANYGPPAKLGATTRWDSIERISLATETVAVVAACPAVHRSEAALQAIQTFLDEGVAERIEELERRVTAFRVSRTNDREESRANDHNLNELALLRRK